MPVYAIVDKVDPSPTILLDLNDKSPFGVMAEGVDTSPPSKRFSSNGSTARDGDTIAQSSYNDRVLTIPLRVQEDSTAEQQTEGIQKLGRLLDAPQWIMWQHEGMIEPVFFRTRRGDMRITDTLATANKTRRTVVATIPAEPFAYGLPVTGTATIANDPTAATNPTILSLPDIQGDVSTPLWVYATMGTTGVLGPTMLASQALGYGKTQTVPVMMRSTSFAASPSAQWTGSTGTGDAAMTGGTYRRATASTLAPALDVAFRAFTVPLTYIPGEYRVIARVRTQSAAHGWDIQCQNSAPGIAAFKGPVVNVPATRAGAGPFNVDLGVIRLPAGTPNVRNSQVPIAASNVSIDIALRNYTASSWLDIDRLILVPIGGEYVLENRYCTLKATAVAGSSMRLIVDSIAGRVVEVDTATNIPIGSAVVGGGLPTVLPGASNTLHLLRLVQNFDTTDTLTDTTAIQWLYYPRYLYIRPATS